jgi:AraC-like DNA-binding protein
MIARRFDMTMRRGGEADGTMSVDTLSDVLRAIRLKGAVFFAIDATAPWVAEAMPGAELGPYIMPGVEHVIEYHVITAGSCWGGIVDETPVRLETGDVIVFPQGDAHVMSSAPGMRGLIEHPILRSVQTSPLPLAVKLDGGGPEGAQVICGFLGCDARPFNPLLAHLPRVMHLSRASGDGALEPIVRLALAESSVRRAGGGVVLSRLSELLFVEVVRRHLATLPPDQVGWLAGLRDESIGRVLEKLHERPAHDWSLEELGHEVGMSRSVLAERFTHFVGVPPIQYLAQWRMQLAATLLSDTTLGMAEIAEQVGYGSEAAFSRAYKRSVGAAPADWRRARRGAAPGA